MRKVKFRSFFYDALFVVLIMAAAMASAVLEASAVLGAFATIDVEPIARSAPSGAPRTAAAGSSVDGALVSVAAARSGR